MTELQQKWIEALRSGKYKQGRGKLHQKNKQEYCVLGVLCNEIDSDAFISSSVAFNTLAFSTDDGRFWKSKDEPIPAWLIQKIGINNSIVDALTSANDRYNPATFLEIADILELFFRQEITELDLKRLFNDNYTY